MRVLVLGAGAVGGYFGGLIAQSGADVTFLVRKQRKKQLEDGLRIVSPLGDATIPVSTITEGEAAGHFDLILLTSKAYGLAGALQAIAPHVAEGAAILPFLNGVAHMQQIEETFPAAIVWGGTAGIAATLAEDGTIHHLNKLKNLNVGIREGQQSSIEAAKAFVNIAVSAGINAVYSETIEQVLWDKWIFLTTLAGGTCLMRASIGDILKAEQGETFLLGLFEECTAVATAEGRRPDDGNMANYRSFFVDRTSTLTASLLRDVEQGGQTEADHIVGDMARRGKVHGLATPNLDLAWTHLQCYELSR